MKNNLFFKRRYIKIKLDLLSINGSKKSLINNFLLKKNIIRNNKFLEKFRQSTTREQYRTGVHMLNFFSILLFFSIFLRFYFSSISLRINFLIFFLIINLIFFFIFFFLRKQNYFFNSFYFLLNRLLNIIFILNKK